MQKKSISKLITKSLPYLYEDYTKSHSPICPKRLPRLRKITSRLKRLALIRFHKTLFMSTLYRLQNKSALLRAIQKSFTDTRSDEHYCTQRHTLTRSHKQTTLKCHNFVSSVIIPYRPSSGQYLLQLNKFPSPLHPFISKK
jgi:hypothetical protein